MRLDTANVLRDVAGITVLFTKRATRSIDSQTASFASAARTAGFCPRSRLL
jgi:hypothetical protein